MDNQTNMYWLMVYKEVRCNGDSQYSNNKLENTSQLNEIPRSIRHFADCRVKQQKAQQRTTVCDYMNTST